jgi:hypothetical protein
MTTKEELIAQYKAENPTLTKRVNGEDVELNADEYEEMIISWADAKFAKDARLVEAEQLKLIKISAYQKLGLTEDEIKALGLGNE